MYFDIKQNCKICSSEQIPVRNFSKAYLKMSDRNKIKCANENLVKIVDMSKELPYTRAEFFEWRACIGSIFIPMLLNHEDIHIIFVMDKEKLYLIPTSDIIEQKLISSIKLRHDNMTDPGTVLYYFFEQLIDDDLEKINVIQDNLSATGISYF